MVKSLISKLITFEGGDGSGKSTQIAKLSCLLNQRGIPHLVTREPGGTHEAELIRALLKSNPEVSWDALSEVFLLFAARVEHYKKVIKPALEKNNWVLCDRFFDSTLAYQGYGRGIEINFLNTLYKNSIGPLRPIRTYLLDIDPSISVERIKKRSILKDSFENLTIEFHKRVREGFLKVAEHNKERYKVLDASASQEAIFQEINKDFFEKVYL